jgi:hypothetical protein
MFFIALCISSTAGFWTIVVVSYLRDVSWVEEYVSRKIKTKHKN